MYQFNALKSVPKILCVGKNYLKHVKEMGGSQIPATPIIFMKPWSSISFSPHKLSLSMSKIHQIDHQLELGVFINVAGKNIPKQKAMSHVGGYFLGIDFTDRDFQNQSKKNGMPWTLAKCQDNFCPISQQLISKDINPYEIELEIKVNGERRQKDIASNMHYKIDQIIAYVSQFITLNEGDLIMTGTPDGVGPVKPGDKVSARGRREGKQLAKLQFQVLE